MNVQRPAAILLALLSVAACSGDAERDARAEGGDAAAAASSSVPAAVEAEEPAVGKPSADGGPSFVMGDDGSASMHTRNGAMVMSLRRDSITVAFSDSIRSAVRNEVSASMQKDSSSGSAIGDMIQGVVKSSVTGALGEVFDKSRGFPLSSLNGIAYEQGAIRFDFAQRPTWDMEGFKTDGTPLLAQFHPADAARFVGAVRARLGRK